MWNEHAKITIIGVDDSEWVIHGPGSKSSPVRLREGDLGEFYDAPFSSSYKGVVGRAGKRYTGHHFLERNIVLDLHIYADSGRTWGQVDSDFRRAFDPELEATIVVETELSGERWIKVRLGEHPAYQGSLDPHETTGGDFQYVLVAANPYWCSGTVTDEFVFSGSNWYGDGVRVSNPGDVPAWPKWVLTAPAKYGLPDVSWRNDEDKDRLIFLPFQPHGREVLVDTDPHEEMITANDGTLLWAKMNGQFFQHPIPGRTPVTELPVYVDPFPMLPFNLPVEWRIWIAQKMRDWAEQLGLTTFLALTPEAIGDKIRTWMDGTIPDWVPVLSSDILAEMTGASKTALQGIYDAAIRNREVRAWKRRQRPSIGLYDGDWTFRGQVVGEYSASFDWKLNDTGAGQIVLPYDHHLALWAMSFWKRGTSNVHVRVDKDGERWTGRLSEVVTDQDENGERVTTLNFLHDYEELKHLPVWANPLTPAFVQFPKTFLLAGPSAYILKLTLFLNLVRLNMSLWQLPDDPLSFSGWTQGLNYKEWPILVKPGSLILDDSQWTIINSRFKNFHDLAEPILADGHLMVEMRRWFNGDPQPWPGAGLYRDGQLIIDIVDKSGWFDETAVGGTIAGGLLRTGLNVAENLIDETRMHLNRIDDAPEYEVAGWLGVAPKQPWVTYRTNGDTNTAESTSFTWQPATVSQITTGGHSSPGVNEAMSVGVQLAFNLIGSFMLQPGLGSVADSVLQPLYEDTLFAFMSFKSPFRTMRMGWSHYYENFESGGDKAYTLSSVIAMRKGFWDTRERTLHQMKIGDGAPYLVGANGEGHFSLGDRVGGEIPGPRDGRVVVEQVTGLSLSWDADTPHEWIISTGDMSADHDPIEYLISKVRDLSEAAQDLGVM